MAIRPGSLPELEDAQRDYEKWDSFNIELLKRLFGTDELAIEYSGWVGAFVIGRTPPSFSEKVTEHFEEVQARIHRLDSIVERLELFADDSNVSVVEPAKDARAVDKSNKVFVVHGRDDAAKANLEVFLREIGLDPIVLHRQADEGLTIIEKFEKHADVGYVFVLLTPDECAYLASEEKLPEAQRRVELRARPNVIFEFGYFVGRLGRKRVCCLYTGEVSLPSDIQGLIYKRFVSSIEEVAYGIIKDLKAAGYQVSSG